MNRTLSILDANGLTTSAAARQFATTKTKEEIESFVDGVRRAMQDDVRSGGDQPASLDKANFIPSCSLRGDGGCTHWDCRSPKIRTMARYIALYCDRGIVPVSLRALGSEATPQAESLDRLSLYGSILGLIEMRPLLDAGLAALIPDEIHLCKRHWDEGVPGHQKILRAARRIAERNAQKFSVTYEPPRGPLGTPALCFKGPEDYLEHGTINVLLGSLPKWAAKLSAERPTRLSKDTVKKEKLVDRFFLRMANDAFLETYFGTAFNARYVTDSIGEAEFFKFLYGEGELARNTATLCAHLAHAVPIMTDVPIETIIKLRRTEPEAFENYRSTLTAIVREHAGGPVTESGAKEIYLDVLKPKLDALQAKATNIRRSQLGKGLLKVAASSALIGLGIYGGVLPSQLSEPSRRSGASAWLGT